MLNYYRITQRPVQEEIYDYFDMLGMMQQCDLPLFGFLRRNQFCEAVKQAADMEHLIRSHVSSVMVTFINEPMCIRKTEDPGDKFSKRYEVKGHRHLLRDELEAFFIAARKAIYVENPDRMIKNVEGDYDSPTAEGLPDFHCYTMWYSNHGEPIGRLIKGYLPPVKSGWMIGCGEYGAEGLDNINIIKERYPKQWLTTNPDGSWYPDKIIRAQTHSVQGDWYQEQNVMEDWVLESQKHQANATKLMTDAFRRRADVINHTAIHLLIDAWPSGWMKTLVGCDRQPKQAYFSYMDSLEPLRVNLYSDRHYVYGKETVNVEAWLLNDLSEAKNISILATIKMVGSVVSEYKMDAVVDAATSICAGLIPMEIPNVEKETLLYLDACIIDEDGHVMNGERLEFYVYPSLDTVVLESKISVIGDAAKEYAKIYGYQTSEDLNSTKVAFVSDLSQESMKELGAYLNKGNKAVLLLPDQGILEIKIGETRISTKSSSEVFFAASKPELQKYHFNMLYNHNQDYIDFIGNRSILCSKEGENLVYSYAKSGFDGSTGAKAELPFVKKVVIGSGTLIIVSLLLDGRVKYNPNMDAFLMNCLKE